MFLENIARVEIGVVLKRKEAMYKSENTTTYKIFNIKNYEENIPFEEFYSLDNLESFVAEKGDLLFRLFYPIRVIEVDDKIAGTLVNNQYCLIKTSKIKETYKKDFVKWYLDSENSMRQFDKMLVGTTAKSVPVSKLRKLELPLISEEKQEKLSKIIKLWKKQKKQYENLVKEKEKYYNDIINNEIKKEKY